MKFITFNLVKCNFILLVFFCCSSNSIGRDNQVNYDNRELNLLNKYMKAKEYAKAEAVANNIIQKSDNSNSANAIKIMYNNYVAKNKYDSLIAFLSHINEVSCNEFITREAKFLIAKANLDFDKYDLAIEQFSNLCQKYPSGIINKWSHYYKAVAHSFKNEIQKALNELNVIMDKYSGTKFELKATIKAVSLCCSSRNKKCAISYYRKLGKRLEEVEKNNASAFALMRVASFLSEDGADHKNVAEAEKIYDFVKSYKNKYTDMAEYKANKLKTDSDQIKQTKPQEQKSQTPPTAGPPRQS